MSVLPLGEFAREPAWSVRNPEPLVKEFSCAAYIRVLTICAAGHLVLAERQGGRRKTAHQLGVAATAPALDSMGVAALE